MNFSEFVQSVTNAVVGGLATTGSLYLIKIIHEKYKKVSKSEKEKHVVEYVLKNNEKNKVLTGLLSDIETKSLRDISKILEVGFLKMMKFLRDSDILDPNNVAYTKFVEKGYFVVESNPYCTNGVKRIRHTTMVTGEGILFINNLIEESGGKEFINNIKLS